MVPQDLLDILVCPVCKKALVQKETGESFGNARHHLYRGLEKIRKELVQNRLLAGYIEFGDLEEKSSRR